MSTATASSWKQATKANPCPVCGATHYCSVSDDGAVASCMKEADGSFKSAETGIGTAYYHRLKETVGDRLEGKWKASQQAKSNSKPKATYSTREELISELARQTNGVFVQDWTYQDADGREVFRTCRFNVPGDKTIRPIYQSREGWVAGDPWPKDLPIYRLPNVNGQPRKYICEGEKATDAAVRLGLPAFTSSHGAKGAGKTNWKPLAGGEVVILPDNDPDGEYYAEDVARKLLELDRTTRVKVLRLPGLPVKGDICEYIVSNEDIEPEALGAQIAAMADGAELFEPEPDPDALVPITAGDLCREYPELKPVIIEGLLRETETANIIAPSKVGKTYFGLDLALSVVTGRKFLDTFFVQQGRVLYIDCELHRNTLAKRIRTVASARGIYSGEYDNDLELLPLRGRLKDIVSMGSFFEKVEPGQYKVIFLDALYRLLPQDCAENGNEDMTRLYNIIDKYAEQTRAAFVIVHHASKGHQSNKGVTDVGAGAGAQSRAVDSHLILRPHEQDDAVVMEAAVRSFPPLVPTCLRWTYPTWNPAPDLDPNDLRQENRRRKVEAEPAEPAWTVERFAAAFITDTPLDLKLLKAKAGEAGISVRKADDLIRLAVDAGLAFRWEPKARRDPTRFATIPQPQTEAQI